MWGLEVRIKELDALPILVKQETTGLIFGLVQVVVQTASVGPRGLDKGAEFFPQLGFQTGFGREPGDHGDA